MASVTTSVTDLPESRVRVAAEVSAEEIERSVQQAARRLGANLRVPGFRKGKVPPAIVIRRLGRDAVLDEALRESLGHWYVDAIDGSGIAPIGEPQLDVGDPPANGQPWSFSIEIGVRPTAQLGEYKGLEVARREPHVEPAAIDEELERLRDSVATLDTVDRPARSGDHLVVDYVGTLDGEPFEGGQGRDQLVELGSGRLIPGFEEQLTGATAGEERTIDVTFPEEYPGELGGQDATFEVRVHEVKAKQLPELDDDFAAEASEFDTVAELREDITTRLGEVDERAITREYEQAVLEAVVAAAEVEVPEQLVHARAHELVEQMLSSLQRQGIDKDTYLRLAGTDEHSMAHEAETEADAALRREAVLSAVIAAEGIEPSEEELVEALRPAAERDGSDPVQLVTQLRKAGRLEQLREDVASRQAIELLVDAAQPISVDQAKARDALWTPGKDEPSPSSGAPASGPGQPQTGGSTGQLWTPGS